MQFRRECEADAVYRKQCRIELDHMVEEDRRQHNARRREAAKLRAAKDAHQRGADGWVGRTDGRTVVRRKSISDRRQEAAAALSAHEQHLRKRTLVERGKRAERLKRQTDDAGYHVSQEDKQAAARELVGAPDAAGKLLREKFGTDRTQSPPGNPLMQGEALDPYLLHEGASP